MGCNTSRPTTPLVSLSAEELTAPRVEGHITISDTVLFARTPKSTLTVYTALRRAPGPLSRVEIAERTGLSSATVVRAVGSLVELGAAVEIEPSAGDR